MTTFQRILGVLILAVILFLSVFFAWKIGKGRGYHEGWDAALASAVPDTVWHTDTIRQDVPVPEYIYKDRPVYVPVHDTTLIHHNDTTWVVLDREVRGYADSTYRCEVSGVDPRLDWIEVYQKTRTITNTVVVPSPRFSIGAGLGPGVVWNKNGLHAGVGVVVGIQYRF